MTPGASMDQFLLDFSPGRRTYTVSELTAAIRATLDREFPDVWVAGEISGVRLSSSGHYYFTLKDEWAQLRCACFRSAAHLLRFKPQDGVAVLARGRIDVFPQRGEYQLLVEALEPQGLGALQFAFEQLKKKLAAEGLFDAARKRPLPRLAGRIGIVTSPVGAVIRDMLQILERRFPGLHILIYPVQVQGAGSVEEVIAGLDWFSASGWPDVVIVARGGGSLEDLWTFNEEAVARAIARCTVPVISAVGHETDVTIADFVADLRAPTPSAAAEMVICAKNDLLDGIAASVRKLEQSMRYRLADAARRFHQAGVDRAASLLNRAIGRRLQLVDELDYRLRERVRALIAARRLGWQDLDAHLRKMDLRLRFAGARSRLEVAESAVAQRVRTFVELERRRLDSLAAQLSHLSPLRVLERGYAVVRDEAGRIVKDAAGVATGAGLEILLAKGRLGARVTNVIPGGSSELPS